MGRYSGGYTIIEVLIVIAITSVLFGSAILVFQGEQGNVSFSQTMRDLSSKIQSYASEVSSGTFDGSTDYSCTVSASGQPTLSKPGGNSDSGCVFLGRAFQVTPNQSDLKAFAVIGSRDSYNGGDSGQPATTLSQANPTIAAYSGSSALEEDYTLEQGAVFTSSTNSSGTEKELAAIFNNLQDSTTTSGSAANNVLMQLYGCNSPSCATLSQLNTCIANSCGTSAPSEKQWLVCVKGGDNETAQLEVDDTSSGLTTKVNFKAC